MQPLFADKRGLITGVFNKQSIAWAIADQILAGGGECGFSYMPDKPDDERKKNLGRVSKLTDGNPQVKFLQPMDVTKDEHIAELMNVAKDKLGRLDFLLHSIAFALPDDLKRDTIETSRAGFKLAMEISAYSLIALANAARPLLAPGASILTLTYYGSMKAVPNYNVMGIAKAALEAAVRYLALDFGPRGIRVNAISAGPIKTLAGSGVSGLRAKLADAAERAPLKRNVDIDDVGASGVYLLSDLSKGVTGEIHYVDAGFSITAM